MLDSYAYRCEFGQMNGPQHDILGFGVSAVMDLNAQHETWHLEQRRRAMCCLPQERFKPDLLAAALVGLFGIAGNRIHDALEPAEHPNHRGFFHSWLLFAVIGRETLSHHQRLCTGQTSGTEARLLNGIGWGSCSHFASDATTAKSLPITGLFFSPPRRGRRVRRVR